MHIYRRCRCCFFDIIDDIDIDIGIDNRQPRSRGSRLGLGLDGSIEIEAEHSIGRGAEAQLVIFLCKSL